EGLSTYESLVVNSSLPAVAGPERSQSVQWPTIALVIYFAGVAFVLLRVFLGWRVMRRLSGDSRLLQLELAGSVYESSRVFTPITVGILRPRVLLPETWTTWPKQKLRAILAHETAHIRRRDPLTGFLARVNCALFWFHPMSWWLQKELALTAEQACDDV